MKSIKWSDSKKERQDPLVDWCGQFNGKYVDLVSAVDGTWTFYYDSIAITRGSSSRDGALMNAKAFLGLQ
jgi:hypothetical protein